nr:DUF3596 domain-containing protein [Pseudomonas syringae]
MSYFDKYAVRCRKRITLKSSSTNLKKAEQHRASIEHAISIGGKRSIKPTDFKMGNALSWETPANSSSVEWLIGATFFG